jgi:signal transduction histidine kinase
MSMVAIGILHNLGNLLNGVTVSSGIIEDKLRGSKLVKMNNVVELLEAHRDDLSHFVGSDERGRKIPAYVKGLSEQLLGEQAAMLAEISTLKIRTAHAVGMIATQQRFNKRVAMEELVPVNDLMETALQLSQAKLEEQGIKVECGYASTIAIIVDRHKVLQILLNLVENACRALRGAPESMRELRVRTWAVGDRVWMEIADNGEGIKPEHLPLLFNQGFTTKEDGHGQGLHSSANWARELGGTLRCESSGPGHGASFTLELPAPAMDEEGPPGRLPALVAG